MELKTTLLHPPVVVQKVSRVHGCHMGAGNFFLITVSSFFWVQSPEMFCQERNGFSRWSEYMNPEITPIFFICRCFRDFVHSVRGFSKILEIPNFQRIPRMLLMNGDRTWGCSEIVYEKSTEQKEADISVDEHVSVSIQTISCLATPSLNTYNSPPGVCKDRENPGYSPTRPG